MSALSAMQSTVAGIDLGTTRTVVSRATVNHPEPELVALPQFVTARDTQAKPALPSVLYSPLDGEVAEHPLAGEHWLIGAFAERRASETTGRSILSAKSWLSHAGVDRTQPILPWPPAEGLACKLSPLEAAQKLLEHVKYCWNVRYPEARLEQQLVILTVPASFDQVARQLTLEAASRAGITVRLLEEPIAAFYAFLEKTSEAQLEQLLRDRSQGCVLVVDVGGGTTDFSLIKLQRTNAAIAAERVAVGRHLLLGGDNVDLGLAQLSETRLLRGEPKLTQTLFAQLVHQCRLAKESLLEDTSLPSYRLILTETGVQLVGQIRTAELTRSEVEHLLLEGFLPRVEREPKLRQRGALLGFGLPYEAEPAITRHLARFLHTHLPDEAPLAVLVNGGLFNASCARQRLADCLSDWFGSAPPVLTASNVNTAVAQGAACYGLALLGHGRRIASGTSEAYFVGIESQGAPKAICVLPRGALESERYLVSDRVFELTLGQAIRFDLYAGTKAIYHVGQVVDVEPEGLAALSPVCTLLPGSPRSPCARVRLEGELSATGVIDLHCVPTTPELERAQLSFELKTPAPQRRPSAAPRSASSNRDAARELLERVYGKVRKDVKERESRDLIRNLEHDLGPRVNWPLELNRHLVDLLLDNAAARTRSPDHERVFWLLSGYCLRPGTGAAGDEHRTARYADLLLSPLRFRQEVRVWQQYWIAVRRTCAGLSELTQTTLKDCALTLGGGGTSSKRSTMPSAATAELIEASSYLERLPGNAKRELGNWLLERTWSDRNAKLWSGVARLGSRIPMYSSLHYVLGPPVAEAWLDELMREKLNEVGGASDAAVSLARYTGDRSRDISDAKRQQVLQALTRISAPELALRKVREWVPVEEQERRSWLGDDLPLGLRLVLDVAPAAP